MRLATARPCGPDPEWAHFNAWKRLQTCRTRQPWETALPPFPNPRDGTAFPDRTGDLQSHNLRGAKRFQRVSVSQMSNSLRDAKSIISLHPLCLRASPPARSHLQLNPRRKGIRSRPRRIRSFPTGEMGSGPSDRAGKRTFDVLHAHDPSERRRFGAPSCLRLPYPKHPVHLTIFTLQTPGLLRGL